MTVGHVTKDGQLAGPRVLEHIVDVVLSFEGDRHHAHRVVRGVKNRFGTTMEVGLFEMTGEGCSPLKVEAALLGTNGMPRPGTVAAPGVVWLPLFAYRSPGACGFGLFGLCEAKSHGHRCQPACHGDCDLGQHCGLQLGRSRHLCRRERGLRATEPAADLPLALAIAGAHLRKSIPPDAVAIGELGLGGEIRSVPQSEKRLREGARLPAAKRFLRFGHASI